MGVPRSEPMVPPPGSAATGALPSSADPLASALSWDVLEQLGDLAVAAGGRILEHYCLAKAARAKADGSPVTDADMAAEAVILDGLPAILPGVPVVSEEAAAAGVVPQCGGRF